MTTLWRLLQALWRLVLGTITEAAEWLRRPGNKLRAVCGALAMASLFGAIQSYTCGVQIAHLRQQIVVCETTVGGLEAGVTERDARLAEIAEKLRAEADKLEALRAESAAALGRLADELETAERDAAAWHDRYQQRPDTCKAALELLDSACPSLGGY